MLRRKCCTGAVICLSRLHKGLMSCHCAVAYPQSGERVDSCLFWNQWSDGYLLEFGPLLSIKTNMVSTVNGIVSTTMGLELLRSTVVALWFWRVMFPTRKVRWKCKSSILKKKNKGCICCHKFWSKSGVQGCTLHVPALVHRSVSYKGHPNYISVFKIFCLNLRKKEWGQKKTLTSNWAG